MSFGLGVGILVAMLCIYCLLLVWFLMVFGYFVSLCAFS